MMGESKENLLDFENASIELDIAIDEQDEKKCNCIVPIGKTVIDKIIAAENPKELREILMSFPAIKIRGEMDANDFWRVYFLAKRIRGILQNENTDTQLRKLDWVVDILIREAASKISDNEKFQYLLLMLELAACNMGEQSLGYAEKARTILSDITSIPFEGWNKSAYEALIHYNEGVAKQHMALHDKALIQYDQSIEKIDKVKKYIDNSWLTYVYHPAKLQKAEVLIKMQFSYNALVVLNKIENYNSSIFHQRRRDLLTLTCFIDLSDWDRFDSEWKKIIECEDLSSVFLNEENKCIFRTTSVPSKNGKSDFLNAEKPQPSNQSIAFSLISSYNSLVLEGAKEQLKQEIKDKDNGNIKDFKIFSFIKTYMEDCKNIKFDKRTLEETILDYLEIVGRLITKASGFTESPDDTCRDRLKELVNILKNNSFINEIDSLEKPLVQSETVQKARKVLEEINDSFLKKWFCKKEDGSYDSLPEDVKVFFNFEKDLIEKLLSLVKRPDLPRREYDKRSLDQRKKLLSIISKDKFSRGNIDELEKKLVIYKHAINNENQINCLQKIIKAIDADSGENCHLFRK